MTDLKASELFKIREAEFERNLKRDLDRKTANTEAVVGAQAKAWAEVGERLAKRRMRSRQSDFRIIPSKDKFDFFRKHNPRFNEVPREPADKEAAAAADVMVPVRVEVDMLKDTFLVSSTATENDIKLLAESLVLDFGLASQSIQAIQQQITQQVHGYFSLALPAGAEGSAEQFNEPLVTITPNIYMGNLMYKDSLEVSALETETTTEYHKMLAESVAAELGLGGEFMTALLHQIHEQKRVKVGQLESPGTNETNYDLPNILRNPDQSDLFTPELKILSNSELEKVQRSIRRNNRRTRNLDTDVFLPPTMRTMLKDYERWYIEETENEKEPNLLGQRNTIASASSSNIYATTAPLEKQIELSLEIVSSSQLELYHFSMPDWIPFWMKKLSEKYPEDRFKIILLRDPQEELETLRKDSLLDYMEDFRQGYQWGQCMVKCFCCTCNRTFSLGPACSMGNFETHLKNRVHKMKRDG
ncbi:hypothetical protein MP638_005936 [Amoeboaphelidium occidentale]|nr:hypothetical protein MP638_005936 [Amoeboaphelidium occidentale]